MDEAVAAVLTDFFYVLYQGNIAFIYVQVHQSGTKAKNLSFLSERKQMFCSCIILLKINKKTLLNYYFF